MCAPLAALSATWLVGPGRTHTMPSQVSTLVSDGDTVAIDAGEYVADVAIWRANHLVLRGVGGRAHLRANGRAYGAKAIWVIAGDSTTVESIEFSECVVPDKNGAGIRQEGTSLTVRNCFFHDNETGILTGNDPLSDILIEHSEFNHNGAGDGQSHNLYINHVRSLVFRYNYSRRAVIGHELKSRAWRNEILYNRLSNESDGRASREIDLPNGGIAIIVGNEIIQGPRAENSGLIGYGLEGLTNPSPHRIVLAGNTMINHRGAGLFLNVIAGTEFVRMVNNIMAGPGTVLVGVPTALDSAANLTTTLTGAGLRDPAVDDCALIAGSPAIDAGIDPGIESGVALTPDREYVHPSTWSERRVIGRIDIGAHEFAGTTTVGAEVLPVRLDIW